MKNSTDYQEADGKENVIFFTSANEYSLFINGIKSSDDSKVKTEKLRDFISRLNIYLLDINMYARIEHELVQSKDDKCNLISKISFSSTVVGTVSTDDMDVEWDKQRWQLEEYNIR